VTKNLLEVDDETFKKLALRLAAKPGDSAAMKTFSAPYLQAKLGDLDLFSEEFKRHILNILSQIRILNEQVEEARYFYRLTFASGISQPNHTIASGEVGRLTDAVGTRALLLANICDLAIKVK
jgi:alkanesulfonate monooxygenase SsuD/methylene tetrahydromethanopterin reductase-like flavin-dependent oxidoreductase (luciferase family)